MAHGARRCGAARPRTGAHPPPHRRRGSVLAILPLPHLRSGPHSRPPIGSSAGPARASSATADARTRGGAWEGVGRRGGIGRGAEGRWFAAVAARRPRRGRRSAQPRPPHGGDRGSAVAGRGEGGGASSAWRGGRRDGGAHGRRRRRPGGSGLGHQRKGRKEGGGATFHGCSSSASAPVWANGHVGSDVAVHVGSQTRLKRFWTSSDTLK